MRSYNITQDFDTVLEGIYYRMDFSEGNFSSFHSLVTFSSSREMLGRNFDSSVGFKLTKLLGSTFSRSRGNDFVFQSARAELDLRQRTSLIFAVPASVYPDPV
jgi:hypothetical protein